MRIIVNAISANTGGVVTYTRNLIKYFAARNIEVIVYVPQWFDVSQFEEREVRVRPVRVRFYGPVHRFVWEQTAWRRIIKEEKADVIFSSANYGVLYPRIPQVLLVQGEIYLNPVYRAKVFPKLSWRERMSALLRQNLMLLSVRHSDTTVFPSNVALEAAARYSRRLPDRSVVNYLGVSPSFSEPERRRQWREDGNIRLLYVSVYYPHKDPMTLADATLALRETGLPVLTRITMQEEDFAVWDNAAGELAHLRQPKFAECLEMGRIEHDSLARALRDYDAFVFPSMAETFGFPMVEAMRVGVPLVVSDISVHREICADAAVYFELGNADHLADKIRFLNDNKAVRERLAAAGLRRAASRFSWDGHVDRLVSEIERIGPEGPLKVLINALRSRSGGGVTYLRNMLPLLAKEDGIEVHVCLHEDQSDIVPADSEGVRVHLQRYRRKFWRVLLREQVDLPRLARRFKTDVVFSPANFGPFFAKNHIVMIRNAISVGRVERRPLRFAYWILLFFATTLSLLRCRRAIAVSDYAKRSIKAALGPFLKDRIAVVPHGVDSAYVGHAQDKPREDFLLAVSDIYVQKNFHGLIRAVLKLRGSKPDIRLKIAGNPLDRQYFLSLKELISQESLDENVEFLGHQHSSELKSLYEKCQIFVFPSTVETFGNPLVEAMACGAPIASSNAAAMPEVLGDAAAFFDPGNVDEMADVLGALIDDPEERARLAKSARARATLFSWEETKRRTLDVIRGNPCEPAT